MCSSMKARTLRCRSRTLSLWEKSMRDLDNESESRGARVPSAAAARSRASRPAIHADVLPGDMTRRVRGQIHGGALQVGVVAEAPQRRAGDHRRADDLEQAARQFGREEARADRVDADAVRTPLRGQ